MNFIQKSLLLKWRSRLAIIKQMREDSKQNLVGEESNNFYGESSQKRLQAVDSHVTPDYNKLIFNRIVAEIKERPQRKAELIITYQKERIKILKLQNDQLKLQNDKLKLQNDQLKLRIELDKAVCRTKIISKISRMDVARLTIEKLQEILHKEGTFATERQGEGQSDSKESAGPDKKKQIKKGKRHLTKEEHKKAKDMISNGSQVLEVSKEFGVSTRHVYNIKKMSLE